MHGWSRWSVITEPVLIGCFLDKHCQKRLNTFICLCYSLHFIFLL